MPTLSDPLLTPAGLLLVVAVPALTLLALGAVLGWAAALTRAWTRERRLRTHLVDALVGRDQAERALAENLGARPAEIGGGLTGLMDAVQDAPRRGDS